MRPARYGFGTALTVLAALAIASCGSDSAEQNPDDLWGKSFVATSLTEDDAERPIAEDTEVTVSFDEGDDGQAIHFYAGCNFAGTDSASPISISPERINFEDGFASTLQACFGEVGKQETWVFDLMGNGPKWTLDEDTLTLTSGTKTIVLERSEAQGTATN